jgi:hypothetical protein
MAVSQPRPSQLFGSSPAVAAEGTGNYGQFPDAKQPALSSRPSVSSPGALGVTTGGAVAPAATGNYGMFPDANSSSSPSILTASPAQPAATGAPSSNYGSFAAAMPTPSESRGASSPSLGIVTGGTAVATTSAQGPANYGVIPESRPSSANLGISTGGQAKQAAVAPSSNYGSFDIPRASSTVTQSSTQNLGIVTGGAAAATAAPSPAPAPAGPSNYGVIPSAGSVRNNHRTTFVSSHC